LLAFETVKTASTGAGADTGFRALGGPASAPLQALSASAKASSPSPQFCVFMVKFEFLDRRQRALANENVDAA
jgi:hypothetical protein